MFESRIKFFNHFVDLLKKDGYQNNYFLTDLFHVIKPHNQYSLNQINSFWKEYIEKIKQGERRDYIQLYIHMPFCRSKCNYCLYDSNKVNDRQTIDIYISKLINQMRYLKETFEDVSFKSLYIGGGTPSILLKEQIGKFLEAVFNNFNFEIESEKTFECNPDSITFEKLKVLKYFNINRISFGVQSFSEKVLVNENRGYQTYDHVKEAIENAKTLKFPEINIDLMIGLLEDSAETVCDSLGKIAEFEPNHICLYPLQPTINYIKRHYDNNEDLFYEELKRKINNFSTKIKKEIINYNYYMIRPSLDNPRNTIPWVFNKKNIFNKFNEKTFDYSFGAFDERSCLGFGELSCSYIYNKLRYQQINWVFIGNYINEREQKLYYLFDKFEHDQAISLKEYKDRFNSNLIRDFIKEISILKKLNKIIINRENLVFLPTEPKDRFIYSLYFFDLKEIVRQYKSLLQKL